MTSQYYNLTWNSYRENICKGFSNLQQKEEFVDMTLAAEGYLVKVHKSLVALVSPYLKEIIISAPCAHPIIFLTNINYETLKHIVEYIYTGEIEVPKDNLQSFLLAAAQLNLLGLNDLTALQGMSEQCRTNDEINNQTSESENQTASNSVIRGTDPNETESVIKTSGDVLQQCLNDINLDNNCDSVVPINSETNITNVITSNVGVQSSEDPKIQANIKINTDYKPQQYSISGRGSLQMILNRYIYLMHHESNRGYKRRWRCADYRRIKCKAYVDTEGEKIIQRLNLHNHPFHDHKIMKKVEKNLVYGSLKSLDIQRQDSDTNVYTELPENMKDCSS